MPAHEVESLIDAQIAITINILGFLAREQLVESLYSLNLAGISNYFRPEDLDIRNYGIMQNYHLKAMRRKDIQDKAFKTRFGGKSYNNNNNKKSFSRKRKNFRGRRGGGRTRFKKRRGNYQKYGKPQKKRDIETA